MADADLYEIVEMMSRYGGNFARAIADAFRAADPDNLRRLVDAFPELIEEYRELAKLKAAK